MTFLRTLGAIILIIIAFSAVTVAVANIKAKQQARWILTCPGNSVVPVEIPLFKSTFEKAP